MSQQTFQYFEIRPFAGRVDLFIRVWAKREVRLRAQRHSLQRSTKT